MEKQQQTQQTQQAQRTRRVRSGQKVKEKDDGLQKYAVIMHNDDVTTMDFVVFILQFVFFKNSEDANALMMDVHTNGSAKVGSYVYDIAISKVTKAMRIASDNKFPLKLTCRKE